DHRFAGQLIRESNAWREIVLVEAVKGPVGNGVSAAAGEQQGSVPWLVRLQNKVARAVLFFEERRHQLPARAEVDGEPGAELPVVLRIELISSMLQRTGYSISERPIGGQSQQEVSQCVPCGGPRLRILCVDTAEVEHAPAP